MKEDIKFIVKCFAKLAKDEDIQSLTRSVIGLASIFFVIIFLPFCIINHIDNLYCSSFVYDLFVHFISSIILVFITLFII